VPVDKRFKPDKPDQGTLLVSKEVNGNFLALERANELKPVAGTLFDLSKTKALWVEPGYYATDGTTTKYWLGGFSAPFIMVFTLGNERTDALVINTAGNLIIQMGVENTAGNSLPPPYPADSVAIAEVIIPGGVTDLFNLDGTLVGGVVVKDVRPIFVTSAAGFGINPVEERLIATSGQTDFFLATFTYTPGQYEINVFVDGVRQNVGDDYTEGPAINQIVFNTGLSLNAKVVVWKVGSASAHRLSDLDDVDVATADAVIDPDGRRSVPYFGPSFTGKYIADRNNPLATYADVAGVTASIPFGVQHDSTTGEHGPQVTITQTNDNNALIITKTHTGNAGGAINITNSGSAAGVNISQVGDGVAINVYQYGAAVAVAITDNNTASHPTLLIERVVTFANREPHIHLTQTSTSITPPSVNISFYDDELTFAGNDNIRRVTLNAMTGSLSLWHTGSSTNLTISKTGVSAGGKSIDVNHYGSGEVVRLNNSGTNSALVINHNTTKAIVVLKGTSSTILDPLWTGSASYADSLHTHSTTGLNAGIGISLEELNNVSADLSKAVRDTGVLRSSTASESNPLATIDDVDTRTPKIKYGTYAGNGTTQSINVGFQPDWIELYNNNDPTQSGAYMARGGVGRFFKTSGVPDITITGTGFDLNDGTAPINSSGKAYYYIAFKSNP